MLPRVFAMLSTSAAVGMEGLLLVEGAARSPDPDGQHASLL